MPLFSYRATASDGTTKQGTVDSPDASAAFSALRDRGLIPVDLLPVEEGIAPRAEPLQPASSPLAEAPAAPSTKKVYFPIMATLRLYAGWLLAYYAVVYALGWYAHARRLPFEIPYVEALLLSPLVLAFTLAAFLFLLFQGIYRAWGGGLWKGILLSIIGVGAFVVYKMNVA
jgi:hypothetical protein